MWSNVHFERDSLESNQSESNFNNYDFLVTANELDQKRKN